ncbi:MAG: phytanoyl-CoA dioxygenase family protein [Candidatus Thioglobus autotrophicus]|nr:phytanoyl-CoA dioxygenase family protein [Candidatus Thioglobus autotrophicus]
MQSLKSQFEEDGYFSPLRLFDKSTALSYREILETVEQKTGSLNYRYKIHTVLDIAYKIATNKELLDSVEALLGPNILLYNTSFVIKEPNSKAHISWHQDLTYWGFNDDKQVAAWIALSDATEENGCMHMIPGSHKGGQLPHRTTKDSNNLLHHGQTIEGVSEEQSRCIPLKAGETSLHHGWTMHTSYPNKSDDRRIGLTINYISTDMFQTQTEHDSAMLVRGVDHYNHFKIDTPSSTIFDENAWNKQKDYEDLLYQTYDKMNRA